MIVFLLLLGAASVYGQGHGHGHGHVHSCIHNNHQQMTANQVIASVIVDMEKDGDGAVTQAEVMAEFVTKYDHDGNGEISEDEFVKQWHHHYHDEHDFASYLFHHFDINDDLKLTDGDIAALELSLDIDGDGNVSVSEFQAYLTNLYTNCVTHHGR
ncbi:uncharacterized protein LOC124135275 [Haliotis rufescens]|uniref:uncharacterized protein LOC124135275 n=1 Tax=Haliotis rufescens TaxID=6454 RepID=UPI00201E95E0|nr:uncharacterized protein LOC124135275 [Haliotis rufescens]XP_048251881.1 uncharacterized protein LOC124135275 [Haliotis rufescens]